MQHLEVDCLTRLLLISSLTITAFSLTREINLFYWRKYCISYFSFLYHNGTRACKGFGKRFSNSKRWYQRILKLDFKLKIALERGFLGWSVKWELNKNYARTFACLLVDGQSLWNIKPEPIRSQYWPWRLMSNTKSIFDRCRRPPNLLAKPVPAPSDWSISSSCIWRSSHRFRSQLLICKL